MNEEHHVQTNTTPRGDDAPLANAALAACVDGGATIGEEHRPLVELARDLERAARAATADAEPLESDEPGDRLIVEVKRSAWLALCDLLGA